MSQKTVDFSYLDALISYHAYKILRIMEGKEACFESTNEELVQLFTDELIDNEDYRLVFVGHFLSELFEGDYSNVEEALSEKEIFSIFKDVFDFECAEDLNGLCELLESEFEKRKEQ